MKRKLLFLCLMLQSGMFYAQGDWKSMMHQGYTLPQIQAAMEIQMANEPSLKEQAEEAEPEGEANQYQRWLNHWRHRVLPNGAFPTPGFLQNNWRVFESTFMGQAQNRNNTADWQFYGPAGLPQTTIAFYPGKGRVNALDIHPNNPNELIIGAASSGIWKSTDKGQTWTSKTDQILGLGISDIVRDPVNPNILYAATGDADANRHPGVGIMKSVDGGETWAIVGLTQVMADQFTIARLAMVASDVLLATTFKGIYRSADGGLTWTQTAPDTVEAYGIVRKINDANVFFAGTRTGEVVRSLDGGLSWEKLTLPDIFTGSGRIELGVTPANPDYLVALSQFGDMASSTDGGNTWQLFAATPPGYSSQAGYDQTVAVSPLTTNKIIVGGVDGFRSLDGGVSWEKYLDGYWEIGQPYFYVHSDHHVMKFLPGTEILFNGNDGGVYYGNINDTTSFTDVSAGLNITQYYGLGLISTDTSVIIAGAQDNDGVFFKNNVPIGILAGSDGYDGMIDYNNPNNAYACSAGGYFLKTTDGWQTSYPPDNLFFGSRWDVQMEMNPVNPGTIFLGGYTVEKSTDYGENWATIFDAFDEVNAMDIAPSDSNTIYVNTVFFGLWSTNDGGTNWTFLTSPAEFTPDAVIDLIVHPTDPKTLYLAIGGYSAGQKVWKSADGGLTWTNISANLPNIPVNCITFAVGTPTEEIYLGTDLGVMRLVGPSADWEAFNTGLPVIPVSELQINYLNGSMYAATYGRGIWKTRLESLPVNVGTPTGNFIDPVKIQPNFSKDGRFELILPESAGGETFTLRVFNAAGGMVLSKKLTDQPRQTLELSDVASGVYFVQIQHGQYTQLEKILLTK